MTRNRFHFRGSRSKVQGRTEETMAQQDVKSAPAPTAAAKPVWRGMDQHTLDDAYDQAVHATNREYVTARRGPMSARAVAALGAPQRVAYGTSDIEKLDIYATRAKNAP